MSQTEGGADSSLIAARKADTKEPAPADRAGSLGSASWGEKAELDPRNIAGAVEEKPHAAVPAQLSIDQLSPPGGSDRAQVYQSASNLPARNQHRSDPHNRRHTARDHD